MVFRRAHQHAPVFVRFEHEVGVGSRHAGQGGQTFGDKLGDLAQIVAFEVSDTGIGIPEDKREKIFEHFFQVNNPLGILNQGSGIGLSITQEFIKLLGGRIEVESSPGIGSSFKVYLPFVDSPEKSDEEEAMLSEAYNVKENSRLGCQIYITEDLEGLEVELAPYE